MDIQRLTEWWGRSGSKSERAVQTGKQIWQGAGKSLQSSIQYIQKPEEKHMAA